MIPVILACAFFFLASINWMGNAPIWLMWGVVNLAIGLTFIARERRP